MYNAKIVRASARGLWYRDCIGMELYLWPSLSEHYLVASLVFNLGTNDNENEPKMLLVHKRDIVWLT